MIEKFQQTFRNEIEMVSLFQLQQIQKFVCIWNDHLLENEELTKQEIMLKKLSDDIIELETLLNQCCIDLIDQNIQIIILLTQFFGLIIPIKLILDENLPYLIERYYSQNNKDAKLLIALFKDFNYRELNIQLPQFSDFETNQILRFNKINLFDKTYIQIQQNILSYQCQKSQDVFDQINKSFNNLKIYQTNQQQKILIQQINKFIEYESQELAKLFQDIELNQYYDSIQQLKGIKVIRTKQDLNQRQLFILDEDIHIPEDETIEYKEMAALENKNLFIIKKTITAFMNQKGGKLYIGIKDSLKIKGFYSGNNIFQCKAFLYEKCIDFINPILKQGEEIFIDFIPIVTYEGILVDGYNIIKITINRLQFNQNVYTFSEFIENLHCEATLCFKRYGDESKAVRHQHLKQLIKLLLINNGQISEQRQGRNLITRSISNSKRCSSQKSQDKNFNKLESQIFYKYEFKQQNNLQQQFDYNNNLQFINRDEYNIQQLNDNQQQYQEYQQQIDFLIQQEKPKQEWENWIIIRKITNSIYEKLINYLQILNSKQNNFNIITASTTIHIRLNNINIEDFIKNLKQLLQENQESIQFLYGYPHVIKIAFTDFPLEQAIAQKLKLHNYKIKQKSECQVLIAKHIEDLIEIYKFIRLELKVEVHWKLRESKNITFIQGIEQIQEQQ